jgi:hypothetical protein
MRRHRTIAATLALLAGTFAAPAAALASGPLLSGYGPPGAGAQTILGAALVNGPGSGGGGGGATANSSAGGAGAIAGAGSAANSRSAAGATRDGHGGHASRGSTTAAGVPTGPQPRAAGANPKKTQLGAVTAVSSATSWFSGSDLLALVLASGALALVAFATIRLTRTEHD